MNWPDISQFLLQTVSGAVLTALAFIGLAPTKLGEKFLNHHLDRKLAALRHDQNLQTEELRAKLAHVSDRGIRSNEKEFRAVTAAWEHIVDAYTATMRCAIAYSQFSDLRSLSDDETRRYLETCELSDQQREEIMKANDRAKALLRYTEVNQINAAGLAIFNAQRLIDKQAIFIPDELLASFEGMMKKLRAAQVQRAIEPHYGAYDGKDVERLLLDGESERGALLKIVRQRIFRNGK
ncbi:MAG TPA: hypothetical protein VGG99_25690 [Acetobacteraceae bacterium]|jgi:hypothetical protein